MRSVPFYCSLLFTAVGCAGANSESDSTSGGSTPGAGGRASTTNGGANAQGGAHSLSGGATLGQGGSSGGVADGAGGSGVGGTASFAGAVSTGGTVSSGGAPGAGGARSDSGGTFARGGAASGGTSASGGAVAVGGSSASGGNTARGGASSGGSASGGAEGGVTACATNEIARCSGTSPVQCHFGGPTGNFEVTLTLGGSSAGDAYVEVESYRRMLARTTTTAGGLKTFSFVANVRQPEGQPVQNGDNDGTAGFDVYIRGAAPKLTSICHQAVPKPAMLWIAGDSTVCDQGGTDYAGWGQQLPQFFESPVSVANYADSGESSGSFLNNAKMWGAIKSKWTAGDWVLVQFGHNDKDTSAATFKSNMTAYVTQAKAAGVNLVLVTPISRVGYALAQEHVNSTGANLPQIIRDLAKAQNVPLIDLTVTSWNWLQTINWKDYFALGSDRTHTNPKGAEVIAGFVRDAAKQQNIAFANLLR